MKNNTLIKVLIAVFSFFVWNSITCQTEQNLSINYKMGVTPSFKNPHLGDARYHNLNIDVGLSKPIGKDLELGVHINASTINTPAIIYKNGVRYIDDNIGLEALYETKYLSLQTVGLGVSMQKKIKPFSFLLGTNMGYRVKAYSELKAIEITEGRGYRIESGSDDEFPETFNRFDAHMRIGTYVDIFKGINVGIEMRQGLNNIVREGPTTRYFDYAVFIGYKFKI